MKFIQTWRDCEANVKNGTLHDVWGGVWRSVGSVVFRDVWGNVYIHIWMNASGQRRNRPYTLQQLADAFSTVSDL